MRKQKEPAFTLTHTEILSYAICTVNENYLKEKRNNEECAKAGIDFVSDQWKQKLQALLNLYKLETGNDYDIDIEIE